MKKATVYTTDIVIQRYNAPPKVEYFIVVALGECITNIGPFESAPEAYRVIENNFVNAE